MKRLLAAALLTLSLSACGGEMHEWDQEQTLPLEQFQTLNAEINNGNFEVSTHAENTIIVRAHYVLKSKRKGELSPEIQLKTVPAASSLGLRVNQPSLLGDESLTSHINLTVPKQLALELKTGNGNISSDGLAASLQLQTQQGSLTVKNTTGNVTADTGNGNLIFEQVTGTQHTAKSGNGSLAFKQVTGALQASTTNGNIEAELLGVDRPEDYSLSTSNGNIMLGLPSTSSARIRYQAKIGQIKTSFEHQPDQQTILVGQGAARIKLETSNGNIEVASR